MYSKSLKSTEAVSTPYASMQMVTFCFQVLMIGGLFSGIGKPAVLSSLSIPVIVTMFSRLSSCLTPMIEALSLVLLMARYPSLSHDNHHSYYLIRPFY